MKNEIEHDELLADVLADESQLRAETLELGLAKMRHVRKRRRAARAIITWVPILLFAVVCVRLFSIKPISAEYAAPPIARTEETIPGTSIRVLSDEQLLELFKGRPIALIGPADHQRLVLLDETAN